MILMGTRPGTGTAGSRWKFGTPLFQPSNSLLVLVLDLGLVRLVIMLNDGPMVLQNNGPQD